MKEKKNREGPKILRGYDTTKEKNGNHGPVGNPNGEGYTKEKSSLETSEKKRPGRSEGHRKVQSAPKRLGHALELSSFIQHSFFLPGHAKTVLAKTKHKCTNLIQFVGPVL